MALSNADTEHFRNRMLTLLKEIGEEEKAGEEGTRTVELDQSRMGRLSRMDAMQSQAMAVETRRRRQIYKQRINAALKRIDKGDYGQVYTVWC